MNKIRLFIKTFFIILLVFVLVLLFRFIITLPQIPDNLNTIALSQPTKIYSSNGQIVKALANRQVVELDQISPHVIHALLALEDASFYSHHGISKRAQLRSFVTSVIKWDVKGSGSTITQQLAKNLFFTFERSFRRKFKEIFITFQIERQFSKNEILEAYLNQIDFGSGVYGVELAAQIYFAKHADELTLAEAAILSGIPRWPARYNPYSNNDIAKERQLFVLKRMVDEGYITDEQRNMAIAEEIKLLRINQLYGHADYFTQEVKTRAVQKWGNDAVNYGGLQIFTTLESKLQYDASIAIKEGLAQLDMLLGLNSYDDVSTEEQKNYPQAALVAIDPRSGEVKALVGGRDFRDSQFNRAISNNRSAGSAFKPFNYFAALDNGIVTPTTIVIDEPLSVQVNNEIWEPQNFELDFEGPMTVKWALMKSRNIVSVKLLQKTTPSVLVNYAKKMGIKSEIKPNLSLALGATGVSPLEMAAAFCTFANQGIKREPYLLREVKTFDGTLLEKTKQKSQRIADPQTTYLILDMMRGVVQNGTAKTIRSMGFYRPCAGKTGTTNDYRDAWFVGFTPELVTAVWVGYDDNRVMKNKWGKGVTGASGALPIWVNFMKRALANTPYSDFPIPAGIEFKEIDPRTAAGPMPGGPKISVAVRRTFTTQNGKP